MSPNLADVRRRHHVVVQGRVLGLVQLALCAPKKIDSNGGQLMVSLLSEGRFHRGIFVFLSGHSQGYTGLVFGA